MKRPHTLNRGKLTLRLSGSQRYIETDGKTAHRTIGLHGLILTVGEHAGSPKPGDDVNYQ